jgi:nicotinamidase-related amidase
MYHSNKIVDKKDRKLALVIVDVQKKFIVNAKDTTLESARVHTPVIQKAISMFREAGRPVIWILYDAKAYMEGITEETTSLLDGFEFADTDRIVMKYHMNSFNNTNLSDIVESYGCDSVLLCGMFAQYCVMSTYWGAFDKDLSPYMLKDGLISTDDKFCDLAFGLCKSYDLEELEENLSLNRMK